MLEWMLGLLVVAVVITWVLSFFEVVDLFELIGGLLRLIAALLFAVGAFFLWLVKRGGQEKKS